MTEESDRLLRFGVRTLPVSGQTKRSAMLVGGATFSYGSTNDGSSDTCRDSPGKYQCWYKVTVLQDFAFACT